MENYLPGILELSRLETGSHAQVNESGQVDIRIEKVKSDLSRSLLQALEERHERFSARQTRQAFIEDSNLSHLPAETARQLQINIVIHVVGSRGDVQPFIALGQKLKTDFRHRVRIATHPIFQDFVEQNGLEFFNIGGDPAELMAFMVKNPGLMPGKDALKEGQIGLRRKAMMEIMQRAWRSCFEPGNGVDGYQTNLASPFVADAIIANPPSFAHIHCAERLGIPLHMMFTMPWSPTQTFPHPLSNLQATGVDMKFANFLTYTIVEMLTWQGLGDLINSFREITLGLAPLTTLSGPGTLTRLHVPYSYCWSPALVPKPLDWDETIDVCGFFFLRQTSSYSPSDDLRQFLENGPPPIYIGFGSIVVDDPDGLTKTIFEAVEQTGHRALVSKGWGGLGSQGLDKPSSVFLLGNVPHEWLFSRVSCVVHHGGAGTTAAGIAAGKPTVIVPFFGDQPFWGSMIAKAGAGPWPIPYKELTSKKLVTAIREALSPSVVLKAQAMAHTIGIEDGVGNAANSFHKMLDMDLLECSVLKGHKAAWRLINTELKLSPVVASVLLKNGEIDIENLALYRSREYISTKGPLDPFSGGASALIGTISSLMGGITDIPMEIFGHIKTAADGKKLEPISESTQGLQQDTHDTDTDPNDLKPLSLQTGIDAGKGAARAIGAGLRSPMDFTLALAKGFHNAPRLYGDTTVRDHPEVTGLASGVKAATMGLGQGFLDGISGLLKHPAEGARQQGLSGLAKGLGKAIGGIVLKPAAGVWGVPGYISQGMWQELRKRITARSDAEIIAGRIVEGEDNLKSYDTQEQDAIIKTWKQLKVNLHNNKAKKISKVPANDSFEEELVKENVTAVVHDTSRGNHEEDKLIAEAVETQLRRNIYHQRPPSYEDSASSILSTSTHGSDITNTLTEKSTVEAAASNDQSSSREDDPRVDSDEDENMKMALLKSREEL